jgi:hypothetical protein
LKKIDLEASNLLKMISAPSESNSQGASFVKAELEKLAERRKEIEINLYKITNGIREFEERKFSAEVIQNNIKGFDDMLQKMDPHTKSQLINLVIKGIEYDGRCRQVTIDYFAISLNDKDLWKNKPDVLLRVKSGVIDGT